MPKPAQATADYQQGYFGGLSKLRAMVEKQRNSTGSYNRAAALDVVLLNIDALLNPPPAV
jgi:hypothetical protein